MSSLHPYHVGWRENKIPACSWFFFTTTVFFCVFSLNLCLIMNAVLTVAYIYAISSLHCLAVVTYTVREFVVVSSITLRHQLAWTCRPCSQTSVPCSCHAVVWICGCTFGALCHPLQLAGQLVPASRWDRCNESTGPNLSRPQLIPPFYFNISQMSGIHLIPLCNKRESLFIHITYNSGKCSFVNLANPFQGLLNNDCHWSFHLCDCLLSTWI